MLYTIPDYYQNFKCTADQCEDTCCAGWQIAIDRKSLVRYGKVTGKFPQGLTVPSGGWKGHSSRARTEDATF